MKRYRLLDSLRGFALLNMIAYHVLWDMVYIFGVNIPWYYDKCAYIWQQAICCTFILISGFCQPFSRRKCVHGLKLLVCSVLITCVTLIFTPDSPVFFGVLTLLGSCMLFFDATDKILRKITPIVGLLLSFLLFICTKKIDMGYLGLGTFTQSLPEHLYSNMLTAYLGFPPKSFVSADYFPILPWFFLFSTGYFLHLAFRKYSLMKLFQVRSLHFLEILGRHSLIIYMLHQPLIYVILLLTSGFFA
ncbi:MAG: DUF1624 domain-containing protein [Clostridia bacterium]|nr:DUF1624 domain-containing protein [Clostridia bacterium]